MSDASPLLTVEDLSIALRTRSGSLPIVRSCSFSVGEGETLGIVGESGCGKSVTALAVMGLLEGSQVVVTGGRILFDGRDLLQLPSVDRRSIMGERMAMVFQEPMTSLNPVYRVGDQIVEVLRQHRRASNRSMCDRALQLLRMVCIPDAESRMHSYPHQLSGGQRQRVMIAMALACDPKLIIADEPTTVLDVTVQREVLLLMRDLQQRTGTAIVMISHDLGVVAEMCDKVAVMYRGEFVESASTSKLFSNLMHPYTRGLLRSIPQVDCDAEWLDAIPGRVPMVDEAVTGCAFHPRCAIAQPHCAAESPRLRDWSGHAVACHLAEAPQP